MHEAWRHGYIATATLPDGRGGGILDLRCPSEAVTRTAEFRELARQLCELVALRSPRFLRRAHVPPAQLELLLREGRTEALRRGIPDEEVEAWASSCAESRLSDLCLMELPLEGRPVAAVLEDRARRWGHEVEIRRYHRMSLDD